MKFNKYIVSILSIIVFYSCGNNEKTEPTESLEIEVTENEISLSKEQFEHNNMEINVLQDKSFSTVVKSNGMIDVPPANKAIVNAMMGGYIKTTPLLVGDVVKKGQVLVTIENPDFVKLQQEYIEVKEQLVYLESEFNRQKTLYDEKITSQKKYLKAESNYKTYLAKYRGLKKQLEMLNIPINQIENGSFSSIAAIQAPISGSISKVDVSIGKYVSPSSQIMEIINIDHLHLELSVFEKDIMKLKEGQLIDFKIPEASSEIFEAEVYLIGNSIDENRTIKVHGHLDEKQAYNFLVGMFVEASIITENETLKALPSNAIVEEDGAHYVLLLVSNTDNEYRFKQLKVEIGKTYENFTEIKNASDFSSKSRFLTKGVFSLIGE